MELALGLAHQDWQLASLKVEPTRRLESSPAPYPCLSPFHTCNRQSIICSRYHLALRSFLPAAAVRVMASAPQRDRLGRINPNWKRQQNRLASDGALALDLVQAIEPQSDPTGSSLA